MFQLENWLWAIRARYYVTVEQNALISRKSFSTSIAVFSFICGIRIADYVFPQIRAWVIVLGIVALFIRDKSTDSDDAPLVYIVSAIGLLPIVGWIPGLSRLLDPVLLLASLSVVRGVVTLKRGATAHWFLVPIAISGYLGARRWWHFTQGYPSEILARLYSGWDHFGHFYLFLNSIRFNSFVARAPELIAEKTAYDRQYPAGIQMNWSQWWPQNRGLAISHPMELLHQYMIVVILTAVVSSVLLGIAVARVFGQRSRTLIALVTSITSFMLVFAGPLSITIWNGFPNFLIAIAGVVVITSVCIKPLESVIAHITTLFAGICIVSYNWYPLLVAVAPLVLVQLWKQVQSFQGRKQLAMISGILTLGLLSVIPIVGTFAFGVSHLTVDGGITQLPPNMVVLICGISLVLGVTQVGRSENKLHQVLISPLVVAPIFLVSVATYVRTGQNSYPYYVQKIAMGVVFICLFTLPILKNEYLGQQIETFIARGRKFFVLSVALAAIFGFSISQTFGYIGPDWRVLAPTSSNIGLHAPESVEVQIPSRMRTTNVLMSLSSAALSNGPLKTDCLVFNDIEMQDYDPVLTNYWVGVITWTLTEEHLIKAQSLIPLKTGITSIEKNAEVVEALLSPSRDCPIVSEKLAQHLISSNSKWSEVLWVIRGDGNVVKYKSDKGK